LPALLAGGVRKRCSATVFPLAFLGEATRPAGNGTLVGAPPRDFLPDLDGSQL
jgi:hypothetical protein